VKNAAATAYKYLIALFLALVGIEFFFAGLAVFGIASDATTNGTLITAKDFDSQFRPHLLLGDAIDILSFVVLGAALLARFNRRRLLIPVALLVVVLVQATLAFVGPPAVEALHPVAGLLILGVAAYALRDARALPDAT
jgi:hypothetical protein